MARLLCQSDGRVAGYPAVCKNPKTWRLKPNDFERSAVVQIVLCEGQHGVTLGAQKGFEALEERLRTILPDEYQDCYDDVQSAPMRSAALKYSPWDDKVAWNRIWANFCDLAMAGGPLHKGILLEPGSQAEIAAEPRRYRKVVNEFRRGVKIVTGLVAYPSRVPGRVCVDFPSFGDAGWLVRAINMENVSAYCEGTIISLPAGPAYRVEKKIGRIITVIAKPATISLDI